MAVFTRSDAESTYTDAEIVARLASGRWVKLFRGVYADSDTALDPPARIAAALLSVGPDLVATRETAALLHGFGVLVNPTIQLAGSPATTSRAQPGILLHAATLTPDDVTVCQDVPCTNAARTAIDLARIVPRIDALAVLDAALAAGACTPDQLAGQLVAQARMRGVVQARQVLALADRLAESPMESRLRLRFADGGLPLPMLQHWVCGGCYRLDLAWPEFRVGAEYDGAVHLDRVAQRHDITRRNRLAAAGWTVYAFTDTDVYRRPGQTVATVRRALSRAAAG